jgi:hypothetical protein
MRPAVYFIQKPDGTVKIGYTAFGARARLDALRGASGEDGLRLIRVIDGGRATERWLHRRFDEHRLVGEWFRYHPEMMKVCPPDEVPPKLPPLRLWRSVRELLIAHQKYPVVDEDKQPHLLAHTLIKGLTTEEAKDLIAWFREQAGVPRADRQQAAQARPDGP